MVYHYQHFQSNAKCIPRMAHFKILHWFVLGILLESLNRITNKFPNIGLSLLCTSNEMPNIFQGWYTSKISRWYFLSILLESLHSNTNNSPTLVYQCLKCAPKCQKHLKVGSLQKNYVGMFLVFYWNHYIPIPIILQQDAKTSQGW